MRPLEKTRLFEVLRQRLDTLGDHARESLSLRWELARLEIECDIRTIKRLLIALTVALTCLLVALPLLLCGLALILDGIWGITAAGWSALFGGVLIVFGILLAWFAWRRCRADFVGLEETQEELREDAVWLGEWFGKTHSEGRPEPRSASKDDLPTDPVSDEREVRKRQGPEV